MIRNLVILVRPNKADHSFEILPEKTQKYFFFLSIISLIIPRLILVLTESYFISSPVFNPELSVYASDFILRKRKYLNDHDQGIDFMEAELKPEDIKMLIKHQIDFEEIPKIHKYP